MTDLVIRVYDVRFGDAVLVTIPDKESRQGGRADHPVRLRQCARHRGRQGRRPRAVIDDIIARLKGKPLDLYVMTHEHLDHVQGMLHASENLHKAIRARQVWLTGSADPDYYKTHERPRSRRSRRLPPTSGPPPGSPPRGSRRRSPTCSSPTTTRGQHRSASITCATS